MTDILLIAVFSWTTIFDTYQL